MDGWAGGWMLSLVIHLCSWTRY